jgi:hypothetical protein
MRHAATMDEDALDEDWQGETQGPTARGGRRKPLPWLRAAILSGCIVAGLAYFAQRPAQEGAPEAPRAIPQTVLLAPAPTWTAMRGAAPLYALATEAQPSVQVRGHSNGGREDVMSWGNFGNAGYSVLVFTSGNIDSVNRSLFVETVHRAASAGLFVARSSPSRTIQTKFGPAESASVTLGGTQEQECQAFRYAEPGFRFGGWLCGSGAQPVGDGQVACLIDRLSVNATDDISLKAVFARSEGNRLPACSPAQTAAAGGFLPIRR